MSIFISGQYSYLYCSAMTNNNEYIFAYYNKKIYKIDKKTMKYEVFYTNDNRIYNLIVSRDDKNILIHMNDKIECLDIKTGELMYTIEGKNIKHVLYPSNETIIYVDRIKKYIIKHDTKKILYKTKKYNTIIDIKFKNSHLMILYKKQFNNHYDLSIVNMNFKEIYKFNDIHINAISNVQNTPYYDKLLYSNDKNIISFDLLKEKEEIIIKENIFDDNYTEMDEFNEHRFDYIYFKIVAIHPTRSLILIHRFEKSHTYALLNYLTGEYIIYNFMIELIGLIVSFTKDGNEILVVGQTEQGLSIKTYILSKKELKLGTLF